MGVLARAEGVASPILTPGSVEFVDQLSAAYQNSQLLLAAHRLGVFVALRDGTRTVENLANVLDTDPRATRILCDALIAIGLLERSGESAYGLAQPARDCLLPDSPNSKHALLSHTAGLYERWAKLADSVKTGRPVPEGAVDPRIGGDAQSFTRAMADASRDSAVKTAAMLELSGVSTVLDIGGGPGVFAIAFARAQPDLKVVVLDRPEVLDVAAQRIEQERLSDRIELRSGDAFTDDLGGPYDIVFVSNLIHLFSVDQNRQLLARCADALRLGGRVVVKDFLMDDDRTSPPGGAVFAVTMLLGTDSGDCYRVSELRTWLADVGCPLDSVRDITPKSRLAVGIRVEAPSV